MSHPFLVVLFLAALLPSSVRLQGIVADEDGKPVADLEVIIVAPEEEVTLIRTDVSGTFEFTAGMPGLYRLSFNKSGFFRLADQPFALKEGNNEITVTVHHETELHESVSVYSSSETIDPEDTSHSDLLLSREIRDIPVKSTHDLKSSLQVLPEVVRHNSGQIHVAGGRPGDTKYLIDGFDIGDPVTGNLSLRVNVDNIRTVEVESGRYDMQHDSGGAGLVIMDTDAGDDRWRGSATNMFPGFSTERGLHMTSWYPRLALSGPINKGRAWFSESLSVQRTLSLVEDLPRDADSVSQWAGDSLLRTQVRLNPANLLQGNFLYNQRNVSNVGLSPTSPLSTTRGTRAYRSFFSLKDQLWSGRSFYEVGAAADFSHFESLPHGLEPYAITPDGSSGNYFETLREKSRRWQTFATANLPGRQLHGKHDLQFGVKFTETGWSHAASRNRIEIRRVDGSLLQETTYEGAPRFHLKDRTAGIFVQDVWRISRPLTLQLGARLDWNQLLHTITPSQRVSVNILPFEANNAKLTLSWGVFLRSVTLSTFGPLFDLRRSDAFYNRDGDLVLGPVTSSFHLPSQKLKQPLFYTTTVAWEQNIGNRSLVRLNYTRRDGRFGLAYEREEAEGSENYFVLRNTRRDRYRSYQVSFRHSFDDRTGLSASYTRSKAFTNHVFDHSLDSLVFAPQQSGPLDWDAPNRFVSSGWAPLSFGNLLLSYFFEHRTGFPFSIMNDHQQIIGPANGSRLAAYTSLNVGVEKRVHFLRNWAIRISLLNVFGRHNPDMVINNIDSPDFLKPYGGQKRALNMRIRLIQ